jgi:hypothetical protein
MSFESNIRVQHIHWLGMRAILLSTTLSICLTTSAKGDAITAAASIGGPAVGALVAGQIAESTVRQMERAGNRMIDRANMRLEARLRDLDKIVDDAIQDGEAAALRVTKDIESRARNLVNSIFEEVSVTIDYARCAISEVISDASTETEVTIARKTVAETSQVIQIRSIVPQEGRWGRKVKELYEFEVEKPFTRTFRKIEATLLEDLTEMTRDDPAIYVSDTYALLVRYARRAACDDSAGDAVSPSMRSVIEYSARLNDWNTLLDASGG